MEKLYRFQIIVDTVSLNGIIYKINYGNNNIVLYSSKLYNEIEWTRLTHVKMLYFTSQPGLTKTKLQIVIISIVFRRRLIVYEKMWKMVMESHGNCSLKVLESHRIDGEKRVETLVVWMEVAAQFNLYILAERKMSRLENRKCWVSWTLFNRFWSNFDTVLKSLDHWLHSSHLLLVLLELHFLLAFIWANVVAFTVLKWLDYWPALQSFVIGSTGAAFLTGLHSSKRGRF